MIDISQSERFVAGAIFFKYWTGLQFPQAFQSYRCVINLLLIKLAWLRPQWNNIGPRSRFIDHLKTSEGGGGEGFGIGTNFFKPFHVLGFVSRNVCMADFVFSV